MAYSGYYVLVIITYISYNIIISKIEKLNNKLCRSKLSVSKLNNYLNKYKDGLH